MKNKRTILLLYRNLAKPDLKKAAQGKLPKDYFYYFHTLQRIFEVDAQAIYFSNRILYLLHLLTDKFLNLFFKFDFPIIPLFWLKLKKTDIVFATTPKLGLMLVLLKKTGRLKSKLVVNICGLYDQLQNTPYITRLLCRSLLNEADLLISSITWHEARILSSFLNIPLSKFQFALYSGIDTNYFSVKRVNRRHIILGFGVDPARDWQLYRNIALSLPQEKFVWATNPKLISQPLPANVTVKWYSTPKLLEEIHEAKLILILTKHNHHFSGQASIMRAMSCGKVVIFTSTPGVEEFPFKHLYNCVLVQPGNTKQVSTYINELTQTPRFTQKIGNNAARMIRHGFRNDQIGQEYLKLFERLV